MAQSAELMSLSDDCLIRMLNFLPAYELQRVQAVCRRFSQLKDDACSKRHSLVLYGDVQVGDQFFTDIYDFYRINGKSIDYRLSSEFATENTSSRAVHLTSSILPLSDFTFATLGAVFSGVTALTIVNNSHSNEWPSRLITALSPTLTTLKLINPFITRTSWSLLQRTLSGTLLHLQHLYISSTTEQLMTLLPFLASISLQSLFIACFHLEELPRVIAAVEHHLPRLKSFAFRSSDVAHRLAAIDFGRTKKSAVHVHALSISIQSILDLQLLITKWSNLTTLYLCLAQMHETDELPAISECLSRLQSLDSLTSLKVSLCPWYQANVRLADSSTLVLPTLPRLRRVHFKLILDPHLLLPLVRCFPSAEVTVEILVNYVRDRELFGAFCQACVAHLLNRLLDADEDDEEQIGQSVTFHCLQNGTSVHCLER